MTQQKQHSHWYTNNVLILYENDKLGFHTKCLFKVHKDYIDYIAYIHYTLDDYLSVMEYLYSEYKEENKSWKLELIIKAINHIGFKYRRDLNYTNNGK